MANRQNQTDVLTSLRQTPFTEASFRNQSQPNQAPQTVSAAPIAPMAQRLGTSSHPANPHSNTSRPYSNGNYAPYRQNSLTTAANGTSQLFNPGVRTTNTRQSVSTRSQSNANSVSRAQNSSKPNSRQVQLSIRDIHPLKDALALFRDGSPLMTALAQTVMQGGWVNLFPPMQREKILDFKGFGPSSSQNTRWLIALNKNDLDILAWVFCVSKHGRKDEVARRIVSSLRAPLKFRIPSPSKKPMIPHRIDARWNGAQVLHANAQQHVSSNHPRGNMPSLGSHSSAAAANGTFDPHRMINNLHRQISNVGRTSTPNQTRDKQMQSLCNEALTGYAFDVGENPFNKPLNAPLGYPRYIVFTGMQLSRGVQDPILRFLTPPPADPVSRPEVKGGDVQVHLRCLRVEFEKPKSAWQQAWPFPAQCRVNGNIVTLNQAQRYTNGKLAGRDAATNITPYLRKYKPAGPNVQNTVVLRRQPNGATAASGQFVLIAQEILVLSHETMTKSVFEASEKYWNEYRQTQIEKGVITKDESEFEMAKKGVMQFLTDPEGLTVSSMKVSLRCPLALTRIKTPVKGKRCQHVQCFDLDNYLEYTRRSSKFECPVCNKPTAQPAMLVISPYITHALSEHQDCDEVEISADGSMVRVEPMKTGVASDDEDDDMEPKETKDMATSRHRSSAPKACEVVDLTLDSDDEIPPAGAANARCQQGQTLAQTTNLANALSVTPNVDPIVAVENDAQVDQDLVFTFRSGDYNWGEQAEAANGVRIPTDNTDKDNWECEVIALDSD